MTHWTLKFGHKLPMTTHNCVVMWRVFYTDRHVGCGINGVMDAGMGDQGARHKFAFVCSVSTLN